MADDKDGIGNLFKDRKLAFLLITAATASILITIYHLFFTCLSNRRHSGTITNHPRRHFLSAPTTASTPGSTDRFLATELIPSHKYHGGDEEDDAACPVCLGELEEEEVVRTLPGCSHTFHAACIDMWLFSHVTCPVCRADATPSPSPRVDPTSRLEVLVHS